MKLKQNLVITNIGQFLSGNYDSCLTLFDHKCTVKGWVDCGEIEVEIGEDVIAEMDSKEQETVEAEIISMKRTHCQKLGKLERRLAELTAAPEVEDDDDEDSDSLQDIGREENAFINSQERR